MYAVLVLIFCVIVFFAALIIGLENIFFRRIDKSYPKLRLQGRRHQWLTRRK